MNAQARERVSARRSIRAGEQARAAVILLALVSFLLGVGGGFLVFHRGAPAPVEAPAVPQEAPLSASTRAVLGGLDSPVTIRFYSLLDAATVAPAVKEFSERVALLLAEYQRAGGGKIQVIRQTTASQAAAAAAAREGLKPFNLDKGEACYLGLSLAHKDRTESLPQLAADWEPALEADLTRAIARLVAASKPSPGSPGTMLPVPPAVAAEVRRLIPNAGSVSLEEGLRLLRQQGLAEFAEATQAMETQLQEAEQRLTRARADNAAAAQEEITKEILRIRTEQAEKARQIAARLQAQTDAWTQMKQ